MKKGNRVTIKIKDLSTRRLNRAHLLTLALLISCSAVAASQESQVFTDEDLSRYDTRQDRSVRRYAPPAPQNGTQPQWGFTVLPRDDGPEKDKWCQKGKDADDRIEVAKRKLVEANSPENPVAIISGTSGAMAQANLRKYQEQVQREYDSAIAARQQLEDDAHRRGIPPGWIRCQFE